MNDGILDAHRGTIVSLVTKQLLGVLAVSAPWTRLPVISFMVDKIISLSVRFILDKSILGINLYMIRSQTESDVQEITKLLEQIKDVPPENREAKDAIEEEIIERASSLISLTHTRV